MMTRTDRPNMFIKELKIYLDFLKNKIDEINGTLTTKQEKYFLNFITNLKEGIHYYSGLFSSLKGVFENARSSIIRELEENSSILNLLRVRVENLSLQQKTERTQVLQHG